MSAAKQRTAVLVSGRGSNLGALIDAAREPDFPAELALVVSNRPHAPALGHAAAAAIPTGIVDHTQHPDRQAFEAALGAALADARIDLVCLAGFMRVLSAGFVGAWNGRMLNIHPSLLPAFRGLDTHRRALAAGVTIHGCTVHLVTPEIDDGPIVMQAAVPVEAGDDEASLAARVLAAEHRIYPAALRMVAAGTAAHAARGEPSRRPSSQPTVLISPPLR